MEIHQALYFRDQLRQARAKALRDAEAFSALYVCLEQLGSFLDPSVHTLYKYRPAIEKLAARSALADEIPRQLSAFHAPFTTLFEIVRRARNETAHEGASARNMTANAVTLALVLEDALVSESTKLRDYMVLDPVHANLWEPLSFIRQKMLLNSFSFLPVRTDSGAGNCWHLLSDLSLARFLRSKSGSELSNRERKRRLALPLSEAVQAGDLELESAPCFSPSAPVSEVAHKLDHRPALVLDDDGVGRLLGIVTAFDLL